MHGVLDFYRITLPGMRGPGIFPVHRTFFKEAVETAAPLGLAEWHFVDRRLLASPPLWEVIDAAGLPIGVVDGYLYSRPAFVPSQPASFFIAYGAGTTCAAPAAPPPSRRRRTRSWSRAGSPPTSPRSRRAPTSTGKRRRS